MRPDDGRAIPTFIRQALRGEPITVFGDGTQTRSICYINDLVGGSCRLLHSDHAGPVNIGNPQEMTVLEMAEEIRDAGRVVVAGRLHRLPEDDPKVRQPDITLARAVLGWEPQVPMRGRPDGTIEWFARHPDVVDLR